MEFPFSEHSFYVLWSRHSKPPLDSNRKRIIAGIHQWREKTTKHLKLRSDWVQWETVTRIGMSNENEYSILTMTSRFLFKSRVSWIESLKFESNQYQIAWYLNRIEYRPRPLKLHVKAGYQGPVSFLQSSKLIKNILSINQSIYLHQTTWIHITIKEKKIQGNDRIKEKILKRNNLAITVKC